MLNLEIYQIIIIVVAIIFIADRLIKYRRQELRQSFFKVFITVSIWLGILIFILFPNLAHLISEKLGMGSNLNTLIFIGFIVTFGLLYRLLTIIEKLEKDIIEIVRKEALRKLSSKNVYSKKK